MKIINLHGKIGKEFGERWELDVESIVEGIRAIEANTGRFFQYLIKNKEENKTFSFILDDCPQKIEKEEELLAPLPEKCKEFHIIPNAEGAWQAFTFIVVALATGFIMRALFKPPKPEEEKQTKSFLFSGGQNVSQQGVPVPLGYGRLLVGSVVISATMNHVDRHYVDYTSESLNSDFEHVQFFNYGNFNVETYGGGYDNLIKYMDEKENPSTGPGLVDSQDPSGPFSLSPPDPGD